MPKGPTVHLVHPGNCGVGWRAARVEAACASGRTLSDSPACGERAANVHRKPRMTRFLGDHGGRSGGLAGCPDCVKSARMMMTLSAGACAHCWSRPRAVAARLDLVDLPACPGGAGFSRADAVHEPAGRWIAPGGDPQRADKVGCACLLLVEREPLGLAGPWRPRRRRLIERGRRVPAPHVLGCAIAVQVPAAESDKAADLVVEQVRRVSERRAAGPEPAPVAVPRPDVHADRLTDLIKRIGGFRVGTYRFPGRRRAEPRAYLRRLAPYAAAVCGATVKFVVSRGGGPGTQGTRGVEDEPYDLGPMVEAILSVGFEGQSRRRLPRGGRRYTGCDRGREALEALLLSPRAGSPPWAE